MYLKRFSWRSICSLCVINHTFFPKIYSHCGDEFGIEFIVCVSIEKCCLPDSWVSKGQEFNQIIIVSISHSDGLGGPARGAGAARALVSGFGARSGLPELRVPASNHRAPAASLTESRSWALLLASATCGCWSIVARPDSPGQRTTSWEPPLSTTWAPGLELTYQAWHQVPSPTGSSHQLPACQCLNVWDFCWAHLAAVLKTCGVLSTRCCLLPI